MKERPIIPPRSGKAAPAADKTLPYEAALAELVGKITGADSGDLLADARAASKALDARVAELHRQHARIAELEAQLEAIGAGGVEPLRSRRCLHQIAEPGVAPEHALKDVRCECCGYMTYHREHIGCIRAALAQEPVAWKWRRRPVDKWVCVGHWDSIEAKAAEQMEADGWEVVRKEREAAQKAAREAEKQDAAERQKDLL